MVGNLQFDRLVIKKKMGESGSWASDTIRAEEVGFKGRQQLRKPHSCSLPSPDWLGRAKAGDAEICFQSTWPCRTQEG